MKIKLFVCLALLNSGITFAQKKVVEVEVLARAVYCGGARPSDDLLAELTKPKPYANKKMVLVSAKGKTKVVETNANGSFTIKLAQGTYKLMEAWRYNKTSPNGSKLEQFDKTCIKSEWEKETIQIEIIRNEVKLTSKNEIVLYCDWAYPCLMEAYKPQIPE